MSNTPKNWRRISMQKCTVCELLNANLAEQKFCYKSIYDSRVRLLAAFFFLHLSQSLLEGVRNGILFSSIRFMYLSWLQLHAYFLFRLMKATRNKQTRTKKKRRQTTTLHTDEKRKRDTPRPSHIKMETFPFPCLRQTIWYRLTTNAKWFWQTHIKQSHTNGKIWPFFFIYSNDTLNVTRVPLYKSLCCSRLFFSCRKMCTHTHTHKK